MFAGFRRFHPNQIFQGKTWISEGNPLKLSVFCMLDCYNIAHYFPTTLKRPSLIKEQVNLIQNFLIGLVPGAVFI